MKKVVISTTINPPTEAIQAFDAMKDWTLIVVGDLKTPKDYKLERGHYVTPPEQEKYDKALSDCIGWNCIQRRNFGFLFAVKEFGADIVATVDDDNVPLPGWGEHLLVGSKLQALKEYQTESPAFDPVGESGYPQLWHRGFPLQLVSKRERPGRTKSVELVPDIQADFWNGDPDVDAICRMTLAPDCEFDPVHFPFSANKIGPFNSQNTFLAARVLKDYCMFPFVGRMDDIWPSFYAQALGYKVVWNRASVRQQRLPVTAGSNPNAGGGGHIANMKGEYLGYENNLEIVKRLPSDPEAIWEYCPGRTRRAFELYRKHFV